MRPIAGKLAMLLVLSAVPLLIPTLSTAVPIFGANVVVTTTGDVIATFQANNASFDDRLFLDSPSNVLGQIFFNHGNSIGDTRDLGTFTAGTVLTFRLHVDNTNSNFFSGPAGLNPDGLTHASVDAVGLSTTVAFEDVAGPGSDRDFNDLTFSFTNTTPVDSVPEPATVALFSTGLLALLAYGWRRRK